MVTPRQILFKAKRKDNGEWIEGYYSYREWVNGNKKDIHIIHGATDEFHYYQYEIYPTTRSQFTGLKDKYGNKIFENDIVEISGEEGYFHLHWEEDTARFIMENYADRFSVDFDNYWSYEVEVCGNIFDNKELLSTYETDYDKTYEKEYMRIHIETEEDLNKLDRSLDSYEASNHYSPYIVCSKDTKQMLNKYKDRFPLIKDKKEYQGLDMYYFVKIKVDNDLPFGEIKIR